MIEGLKPYAEYKESGLPWLGRVPAHWDVRRTKLILREVDSRSTTGKEQLLRVSQYTGVTQRKAADGSDSPDTRAASLIGYKRVSVHDLVINIMLAWNGSMGVSRFDGIASPAYCVYRLNKGAQPWYFHQLFRLPVYKERIKAVSTGVIESRLRLYSDDLGRIEAILPPPDEQAAIVRFLDHANRKIDAFIRAKRKLIGLLNEQKQAIIHRAVTGKDEVRMMKDENGNSSFILQPSTLPKKPSGIPWLGDIPQHWTLKRFKFIARINSGQVDPREPRYRKLVLIAPNHIQSGSGKLLAQETADEQGANSGKYLVSRGQIIYSKIRPNLRKATIAPCDCLCSADMYPITPTKEVLPEFLLLLLLSQPFTKFAVDCSMRVAMPKVNREALANCLMWYPEQDEQRKVLSSVERESAPYDTAIARTEREIALMQEYRTRLTADLVTGKLDVREAAAKLPELPADTSAEEELGKLLDEPEAEEEK